MSSNRTELQIMGKRISEIRKSKGLTQKQLGDLIYASDKTISKWERGIVAPDITVLKSLSDKLEISLDELLFEKKNETLERNEAIAQGINIYTKKAKRKWIKLLFIVCFTLIFVFSTIYFIERKYRWNVAEIELNDDISIHGYIITNNEGTKFIIDDVLYYSDKFGMPGTSEELQISNLKFTIQIGEREIFSDSINYDSEISLHDALDKFYASYEFREKISNLDYKNLIVHFEFTSTKNKTFHIETKLFK